MPGHKGTWPMLRVLVPPPVYARILEEAKASETPVSKFVRGIIERHYSDQPETNPVPPTKRPTSITSEVVLRVFPSNGSRLEYTEVYERVAEIVEGEWTESRAVEVDDVIQRMVERGELVDHGNGEVSRA